MQYTQKYQNLQFLLNFHALRGFSGVIVQKNGNNFVHKFLL